MDPRSPTVSAEPASGVLAQSPLPQRGVPLHRRHATSLGEQRGAGDAAALEGELTARRGELADTGQQARGLVGCQVEQQPFGEPRGRCGVVEPGRDQLARPVPAQVDRNGPALARGHRVAPGQHLLLEREHLGEVELEHPHRARPPQPQGACVEPGGEQHHLGATGSRRGEQVVVEEPCAQDRVEGEHPAQRGQWPQLGEVLGGGGLLGERPRRGVQEPLGVRVVEQPVDPEALAGPHHRHPQGCLRHALQGTVWIHRRLLARGLYPSPTIHRYR